MPRHARPAGTPATWALGLMLTLGVAGCDKQNADPAAGTPSARAPTSPAGPAAAGAANSDAAAVTATKPPTGWRMPHGWKAYDGKTKTGLADAPTAASAMVYGTDGKAVELSSFWAKGKTVLVFYRGHW